VDAAGRHVAGASVTLTLVDSAVVYASTLTSSKGVFLFPALKPALYNLTVEAAGYPKLTLRNVRLHPAAEISLPPIRLGPSEAQSPQQSLQTAAVDVAFTANDRQMSQLPLPRRDPLYLAQTLPGVQDNGRAPLGIYGESSALANVTYDGMNVGSNGLRLRTDQIGEATVLTGSIEGCGCSQIAFSTPSGGRAFHGAAYWLALPSPAAAQYWADNSRDTPSTTSLNQLGASLGGPLKKDRLFFFLNYEADLDRSTHARGRDLGRHLDRRNGDGGYMVIIQSDRLTADLDADLVDDLSGDAAGGGQHREDDGVASFFFPGRGELLERAVDDAGGIDGKRGG